MASIYTGLAFMHGHIADSELARRLGRDEDDAGSAAAAKLRAAPSAPVTRRDGERPAVSPLRTAACDACA